ncbi:MAG: gliding motility-associated C-terminal domain-containing protein [Bacteroidales bacterium]|jgi:gliding motility-associated-like protein|nr:gliding motility-associated C-terminal domain-containing protein [Bacteroidales bacterium]
MKRYDDIGKLYKDMFSDYTPEPPAHVWDNIQAINRKKPSLWKKITFPVVGVVIVSVAVYLVAVNSQQEKSVVDMVEEKIPVEQPTIDYTNSNAEQVSETSNNTITPALQSIDLASNTSETEIQMTEQTQNANHSTQNNPPEIQSGSTSSPFVPVHRKDTVSTLATSPANPVSKPYTERVQRETHPQRAVPIRISKDTMVCENSSLQLYAYNVENVRWSTGETQNRITVYPSGMEQYSVTFTTENMKDSTVYINVKAVECTDIYAPNIFTPNGDGLNDFFLVKTNMELTFFEITIYATNGKQVIFTSKNINQGWDGTYRGQLQPQGVYYYIIRYVDNFGKNTEKRGELLLILQ